MEKRKDKDQPEMDKDQPDQNKIKNKSNIEGKNYKSKWEFKQITQLIQR